jgi:hypothetical protein
VPSSSWVIKVNFDATFKTETYQGASGVVLRNAKVLVVAKCKQHGPIPDALAGPSLGACRMGDGVGPLILIGLQLYSTTQIAKHM